jgi:hypothetical protein
MENVLESRHLGERDGFNLIAYKVVDIDGSTDDADCYDETDIEAYTARQWSYVGIVVKAFRDGIELGEDAIWGVEDGYLPGAKSEDNPSGWVDGFAHTLGGEDCYDVPGEAIEEAKAALAKLRRERRTQLRRWPVRRRVAAW